jgi:hypothetical protein
MPSGIRFDPPRVELTADIRWVLLRSLGPVNAPPPAGLNPATLADLAYRLGVDARIAARMGRDALVTEIEDAAAPLLSARVKAMGTEIAQERTLERCAEVSVATGIAIAVLKGHALRVTGRLAPGGRLSADLDLLVAEDCAANYHAALRAKGFDPGDSLAAGPEHHLAGLVDPEGGVVEVHTKLLGVSLGGRNSVRWADLKRRGLLEALPDVGEGCFVPARRVLAAHALAHGIAQHGRRPGSYALLWMLGDLIDLKVATPSPEGSGRDAEEGDARDDERESLGALVDTSVSREEVAATLELAGVLGRGELMGGAQGISDDARLVLDHVLAGRLDEDYRSQAPLRVFHGRLSDKSRARVVAEDLVKAAFPTRSTLEASYGKAGVVLRMGQRVRWLATRVGRLLRAVLARRRKP